MSTVQEAYVTGSPASGITRAHQNTNRAVRVDEGRTADRGDPAIPVSFTGSAANANEVLGELLNYTSAGAVRVKTKGILVFRASAAYAMTQNGHGVVASTTAGVVTAAGALGVGLGRIIGGYAENSVNYLIVFVQ